VTQRSCDAAGFQGGSGFPMNGGDFPVVLHWSGPSRDLRGRLNQSKTHRRVALTERGGLVAAAAWILAWETVLRQPERTGSHRVEGSALRTLDSKWRRSLPHGSSKVLLWRWTTSWRREMRRGSGPRPCLATRGGGVRRCGEHGGGLVVQQRLIMVKAGERRQSGTGQKWGRMGRSGEEGKWVGPRAQ
jgi:hypothetical protein